MHSVFRRGLPVGLLLSMVSGCGSTSVLFSRSDPADPWSWDRFALRPWAPPTETPADIGLEFEDLRLPTSGGLTLSAWYLPAKSGNPRSTFLFHTGAEGNIARFLPEIAWGA